jgi:hypothetical protein
VYGFSVSREIVRAMREPSEIGCLKALIKPVVDCSENLTRLFGLGVLVPKSGKTRHSAQLS